MSRREAILRPIILPLVPPSIDLHRQQRRSLDVCGISCIVLNLCQGLEREDEIRREIKGQMMNFGFTGTGLGP